MGKVCAMDLKKRIEFIEEALKKFEGAILIASHDKKFLDAIGAEEFVELATENLS